MPWVIKGSVAKFYQAKAIAPSGRSYAASATKRSEGVCPGTSI